MTSNWMNATMGAAMGAFLIMGCQAAPAELGTDGAGPTLREGLTVEEAEPGFRTLVAYRQGDRVVHIETRRAERTPDEYLVQDPTLPEYGVDVRITDAAGSLIYARIAGDGEDFAADEAAAPVDGKARQQDIGVARAGLAALTATDASDLPVDAFRVELGTLRDVEQAFFVAAPTSIEGPAAEDVQAAELGAPIASANGSYKHRISLYKKHCCVPGGYHSATRTDAYSGTYWSAQVDRCNHGTCPGGSGMSGVCSYTSGYRAGVPRTNVCSTGYGVTSSYSHNCNDDSHLEVIDVRHNKLYATNKGSCHDLGANPGPDGCDPSTW